MVVKVKLNGDGSSKNPYSVSLPTHQLLHGNISQGYAIVVIPDNVHGLSPKDLEHEAKEETTEGILYPSLCSACVKKVNDNLDERYQEQKGKFKLEVV